MVQDDGPVGLDGVRVKFDDERVVFDAGLMLAADARRALGVEALAQRPVRLRTRRPGAGNAGRKAMSLVFAMVLGATASTTATRCAPGARAGCWAAGSRRPRRWGRFCARSRSATCASSTDCSPRRSRAPGRPAPDRAPLG